ncbi:MAG: DUF4126 domain-containing protein [Candidatus Eisenbacteria bacterium]|jgi:hypothetical protein|nr:DUF4126 domain-containing protein [Candidatus Eisenbacteria bacterium]
MDWLLSLCLGIGLSAACGFRVFVPLLVMSIASHCGYLSLGHGFQWIGSWPATAALTVATAVEIVAYLVPWLDNLLDAAASPIAVMAGIIVTASLITDVSPLLRWSMAVIAGGSAAGIVQAATVSLRGASSATTAGVANPVISIGESIAAFVTSALAIVVPLLAALAVLLLCIVIVRRLIRLSAA